MIGVVWPTDDSPYTVSIANAMNELLKSIYTQEIIWMLNDGRDVAYRTIKKTAIDPDLELDEGL